MELHTAMHTCRTCYTVTFITMLSHIHMHTSLSHTALSHALQSYSTHYSTLHYTTHTHTQTTHARSHACTHAHTHTHTDTNGYLCRGDTAGKLPSVCCHEPHVGPNHLLQFCKTVVLGQNLKEVDGCRRKLHSTQ